MPPNFALLSIVYMIAFVALFDKVHVRYFVSRFCAKSLLRAEETDRILLILSACREI